MALSDTLAPVGAVFSGGFPSWLKWLLLAVVIIAILAGIAYIIITSLRSRQKWNLKLRIRLEDTQNGKIYMTPQEVNARRVTLSNGLRLIYTEKEILGKRLWPGLNYHTEPGVYDLILSADNRIFLVTGIQGIDEERKLLQVGIRYPGIDYSLDEVNRDHAKLNTADRRSDLLGIVKAASMAILGIVLLLGLIVGGKYWLEGKEIENQIAQAELDLFTSLQESEQRSTENTNAMILLTDKLKDLLGSDNLRDDLRGVG